MEDVDYSKLFDNDLTRRIIDIGRKLIAKTTEGILKDLTEDQAVENGKYESGGVFVIDPISFNHDTPFLRMTEEEPLRMISGADDEDVEDLEPKVSCKRKNTTEELVRILKLNRARKDDN
jgi:hypothetical protein